MRIFKIISFCLLFSLGFYSCKNDLQPQQHIVPKKRVQVIDDKTIHEVINSLLAIKRTGEAEENNYITNIIDDFSYDELSSEDSIVLKKMDTIFTQQDREFIYEQAKYKPYFKIKKEFIKGYTVLLSDTVKVKQQGYHEDGSNNLKHDFRSKYGNGFYTISMPLFTKNRHYALISVSNCCGGSCGSGISFIVRNTKSGWKIIYSYNHWVS